MRIWLFIWLAFVMTSGPAAAWRATDIGRVEGLRDILVDASNGAVRIVTETGDFALNFKDNVASLDPIALFASPPPPADIIPHATVTQGRANISSAWLSAPTGRYGHGVLGDAIEAAALTVRLRDGRVLRYRLPKDAVYEDLTPRLYDMDGDGADEILLIRSDIYGGAAVSILEVGAEGLDVFAESYPIGLSHRWLNLVGAADFDGDGVMDVAAVVTPHLRGVLTYYKPDGRRLKPFVAQPGFSTHFIGSQVLGMSAILDVNDDGIADIILPSLDRRTLRAVTVAGGAFEVLEAERRDSQIQTSIVTVDIDGRGGLDIVYGLANGDIVLIRR